MHDHSGFIASLFDLSFSEFVTPKIIRFLFMLAIALSGLGALVIVIAGFSAGTAVGILALLLSPVVFGLYVLLARISLELTIVVFRIAENTGDLVEQGNGKAGPL